MGLPARKADRHYTYRDYRAWPEDERWELIDGVAYNMSPAPALRHHQITRNLFLMMDRFFAGKPCTVVFAPVDVFLPPGPVADEDEIDTVVQPDLFVVCDKKKLVEKGCLGAPDLVVEILSPSTAAKDMTTKTRLYERQGVREYWVLDPANKVLHQFVLQDGKYGEADSYVQGGKAAPAVRSAIFEGLTIGLDEVFADR